jgi:hypothetical protein
MYGGGVMFSKNSKSTFKQQCQYAQASQPMVSAAPGFSFAVAFPLYRAVFADTVLGRFGSTRVQH